jgi:hypothetical protein
MAQMKLTPDDLQYLAEHLGLLVGHVRRAPFAFLISVVERRGYDERALSILARLHPQEAHKLVLWSRHQEHEKTLKSFGRDRRHPNADRT